MTRQYDPLPVRLVKMGRRVAAEAGARRGRLLDLDDVAQHCVAAVYAAKWAGELETQFGRMVNLCRTTMRRAAMEYREREAVRGLGSGRQKARPAVRGLAGVDVGEHDAAPLWTVTE